MPYKKDSEIEEDLKTEMFKEFISGDRDINETTFSFEIFDVLREFVFRVRQEDRVALQENYERVSHTHCWDQKQPSACGIPLEKHTQCCLCDLPKP